MGKNKKTVPELMLQKMKDIIDLDHKVKKGEVTEEEANKIQKRIEQEIKKSEKLVREKNRVINKLEKGEISHDEATKRIEKVDNNLISLTQEH